MSQLGGIKSISNDVSSNFHVCVRIRPTSSASFENQGHSENQKYVRSGPENSILLVQPHSTQGDKVFIYDEVFDTSCKTREIFEKVIKPNLGDSLFKGFSHTVLVYGMTGSGKTYTMFGDNCSESQQQQQSSNPINYGLLGNPNEPIVVNTQRISMNTDAVIDVDGPLKGGEVFDATDCKGGIVSETIKLVLANQSENQKTKLKMSYLEIYNESIRDLLSNEAMTADNLMILEDPDKGVYCPLLSEKEISGLDQISSLIRTGNRRRVMASTKLNQFSSRSHAIIQLSLEIEIANNGKVTTFLTPKLYLVDLAGSERASSAESKGVRLKEGSNINKSLLSLGNCITVLSSADKAKRHVPYRDSKLTRLLKESLGGNAKTILIACVTPAFRFVEETINTLKYAQRAKSIKKEVYENVKQIYNALEKNAEVKEVHEEIENLKELLQQNAMTGGNPEEILGELCALGTNATDEEVMRKLQNASGGPPTEEQVLSSSQFQSHKARFAHQFQVLSEHFEDILFRNREIECNLGEHKQAKEQNERLIHEIMDTINPASLTQKDMSYRLDKVNMLRGLIKNNDDVVNRLIKERTENESIKDAVKKELESLYEVKFITECRELSNFQLYTSFEKEKKRLQQQIDLLQEESRLRVEESKRKDQQIAKLKDEIQFVKKKAASSELQLQQQQDLLKAKNIKGRGRFLNVRSSTYLQGSKVTPRNLSQTNTNNNGSSNNTNNLAQSKYLQVQTFVPSSSISASSLRGKSQNMRSSMYNSRKNITNDNHNDEIVGIKSMTDVYNSNDGQSSPSTREYEEFRRKEFIIESQLKNLQKASSTKNVVVYGQRVSENNQGTAGSSTNFQSPNRQSNNVYKASFKSSFIDLAPNQNSDQLSSGQTTGISQESGSFKNNKSNGTKNYNNTRDYGVVLTEPDIVSNSNNPGYFGNSSSYDSYNLGGLANSTGSLGNSNGGLSNSYQPASSSSYQTNFQHYVAPTILYNSGLSQNANSLNGSSTFNNSVSSEGEQQNNNRSGSNQRKSDIGHQEDGQVKRSSFNTDSSNKKSKTVTIATPSSVKLSPQQTQGSGEKSYSGVFSPIIESLQEQSILNTSSPNDPTPVNNKPNKDSRFLIENKQNQDREQNVLLDPEQEFLFISASQLTSQQQQKQQQQQQPQQQLQNLSTFKYSSPYSQTNQKSSVPLSSPYSINQTKNKQQNNNNSNNNSNYSYNSNSNISSNNYNNNSNFNYIPSNNNNNNFSSGLAASYDFSSYNNKNNTYSTTAATANKVNPINSLQTPSPVIDYLSSNTNPLSKSAEIVQQPKPQPKIVNPSFNNYMQNHATYGVINQSLGLASSAALSKPNSIPTTAINLNLDAK